MTTFSYLCSFLGLRGNMKDQIHLKVLESPFNKFQLLAQCFFSCESPNFPPAISPFLYRDLFKKYCFWQWKTAFFHCLLCWCFSLKRKIKDQYYFKNCLCHNNCVKSVRIWSYSGLYSVRMRENTDQNKSEYGHFSRLIYLGKEIWIILRLVKKCA